MAATHSIKRWLLIDVNHQKVIFILIRLLLFKILLPNFSIISYFKNDYKNSAEILEAFPNDLFRRMLCIFKGTEFSFNLPENALQENLRGRLRSGWQGADNCQTTDKKSRKTRFDGTIVDADNIPNMAKCESVVALQTDFAISCSVASSYPHTFYICDRWQGVSGTH